MIINKLFGLMIISMMLMTSIALAIGENPHYAQIRSEQESSVLYQLQKFFSGQTMSVVSYNGVQYTCSVNVDKTDAYGGDTSWVVQRNAGSTQDFSNTNAYPLVVQIFRERADGSWENMFGAGGYKEVLPTTQSSPYYRYTFPTTGRYHYQLFYCKANQDARFYDTDGLDLYTKGSLNVIIGSTTKKVVDDYCVSSTEVKEYSWQKMDSGLTTSTQQISYVDAALLGQVNYAALILSPPVGITTLDGKLVYYSKVYDCTKYGYDLCSSGKCIINPNQISCYRCNQGAVETVTVSSCQSGWTTTKPTCESAPISPTEPTPVTPDVPPVEPTPTTPEEQPTPTPEPTPTTGCTLNVADNSYTCDNKESCVSQCSSADQVESDQNLMGPGGYACMCAAPQCVGCETPKICYSCAGGNTTQTVVDSAVACPTGTTETKPTTCNVQDNTLYFIVGALIVIFLLYMIFEKGPKKGIFQSKKR